MLVGDADGVIWLYLNTGTATNPVLTFDGFIQDGGNNLDVGDNSTPVVVDWNNDGKKDLVVGNKVGEVWVYLNTGTNASPSFNGYTIVNNILHVSCSPEVLDLDKDGKKDLVIGSISGYVYFYKNTGTDANPAFGSGQRLKTDTGTDIKVPSYSYIEMVDWDEDDARDLLLGEQMGYVNLFINTEIVSVGNEPVAGLATDYSLQQNYPNPFNPLTTIPYSIKNSQNVEISIYNVVGQKVHTLLNEYKPAGSYSIAWNASNFNSGIYFYRIKAGDFSEIKKCVLVK